MAYPPALPPSGRTDSTLMAGAHAQDHNAIRAALADLIGELGASPSGNYADLTNRLLGIAAGQDQAAIAAFLEQRTLAEAAAQLARDISGIDTSDAAIDAALRLEGGLAAARLAAFIEEGIAASPALTVDQVTQTLPMGASVAGTSEFPIAAGLYPQRLDQFALVTAGGVAASATDYWFVQLLRYRNGSPVVIAEKTTSPTTGEAITAFKPWTFDTVVFSKYAVIAQGDTLTVRLVKVGAPAALTAPLATFRVPPTSEATQANPALLGLATFTGPDSATTVPAPEAGAWTILDGSVWGVSGNRLYCPVASGTGSDLIVMDAGQGDVQVEVKVVSGFEVNHSCGLTVRVTDASNRYQIGAGNIFKVVGGAATSIGNWTPPVNGDTLRVVAVGATFKIYHQPGSVGPFVLMKELTDSSLPAATKHGIRNGSDAGRTNRFDDFRIEAAA